MPAGTDELEPSTLDRPFFYRSWTGNQHRTTHGLYDRTDESNTDLVQVFDYARLSVREQREGSHLRIGGDLGIATEQFRFLALVALIKRDSYAKLEDALSAFARTFDVQEAQVDSPSTRGLYSFQFYAPTTIKGIAQHHINTIGGAFATPPTSVWRLGEAFGTFRDRGTIGTVHGTVSGTPSRGQASLFGDSGSDRSLVANAGSQGVTYGDVYGQTGASVWSVTGWLKWGGSATAMEILTKILAGANGWAVRVTTGGVLQMLTWNASVLQDLAATHTAFVAGELHHFGFVFGASTLNVYLDGELVGTEARTQNAGASTPQAMSTSLGASGGSLQELAMWQGVELSATEMKVIYEWTAVRELYYARPDTMPQFRRVKSGGKGFYASTQLVCEDPRRYLYGAESVPWVDLTNALFLPNWTTGMGRVVHPVITLVMGGAGDSNLTISDGTRSLVLDMSGETSGTFLIDCFTGRITKSSTSKDYIRTSQPDTYPVVVAGGSSWTMTNRTNVTATTTSVAYRQAR
jgi:hypothetical protein